MTDLGADVCVVMELVGNNVVQKWLSIIALKDTASSELTVSDVHNRTVYGSSNKQVRLEVAQTSLEYIIDCIRKLRRISVTSSPNLDFSPLKGLQPLVT